MKLVLHIGQQKTGSTSLQRFLFDNYNELIKENVLYPKSLGTEHFKQHLIFKDSHFLLQESNSNKENLLAEIKSHSPSTVIISDENLFFGIRANKAIISKFITSVFNDIEIVVYLRRQDHHIPSHYQQTLLGKTTKSFNEWIDHSFNSGYYHYNNVLTFWQEHLPSARIVIKPMYNLVNNDIRYDFINYLKLDYSKFLYKKSQLKNESVSWHILPLLKCLNQLMLNSKNIEEIKMFKSDFIHFVNQNFDKTKLKLNKAQHQRIEEKFKKINQSLVNNFHLNKEAKNYLENFSMEEHADNFLTDSPNLSLLRLLFNFLTSKFPNSINISFVINLKENLNSIEAKKIKIDSLDLEKITKDSVAIYKKSKSLMQNEENIYKPVMLSGKSLYFLHIAKCGGTSVRNYLDQLFGQNQFVSGLNPGMLAQYSLDEISKWKLVSGHLDRSILQQISPDIIVTWLRDPIERFISAYGRLAQLISENRDDFTKNEEAEKIAKEYSIKGDYFTLDNSEFIRNSNLITKSLGSEFFSYTRFTSNGSEKLTEAKRFLTQDVSFYGIMSRMQESMDLLSYYLGQIPSEKYIQSNKTTDSYKDEFQSKEKRDFFDQASDLDKEIWQYAQDLFNERFNKTLHFLWLKNNAYTDSISKDTDFNAINYKDIRHQVIQYMTNEVELNMNSPLMDSIEYTFDKPLMGSGWSQREWFTDLTHYSLRWINQPKACIYLPLERSNLLEAHIHFPHKVTELDKVYIDGQHIESIEYIVTNNHTKDRNEGELIKFIIPVQINKEAKFTKIEFEVSDVVSPNKLDSTNPDKKLKSISVDWIKISPLL